MKLIFIFTISLLFLAACSSPRETAIQDPIDLEHAEYRNWENALPDGSDELERGTDIRLTFNEWPDNYNPAYVVFRNKESFPAELELADDKRAVITARIVRESGVLAEVSETVFLSDRLVFVRPDGEFGYLEIEEWERAPGEP